MSVPSARAPALLEALGHLRDATTVPEGALDRVARALSAGEGVIVGSAPMLREMLLVAIDEAGEALSERCTALLRGADTSAELRAELTALVELLDLLDAADRGV